jgi:CheY-like chemotaxis protein
MGLEESGILQVQPPSRIIIADDHPLFRSAIRHTLEGHTNLEVVGEAATGRQALEEFLAQLELRSHDVGTPPPIGFRSVGRRARRKEAHRGQEIALLDE